MIAASSVRLENEVQAGRFRSDLLARLSAAGFYLPPSSARRAAIVHLSELFFTEFAAAHRPDLKGISAEALRLLHDYDWPGNIRQLRIVLERVVILCPGPFVEPADLPEGIRLAE